MAHYAILDENNVVVTVITGIDEGVDGIDWEAFYGGKRTSYNTRGGVYYDSNTGEPHPDQTKAFRKNYAYIGGTYDPVRDAFIQPKAYDSWILNEQTCMWEAPVPYPDDGRFYIWDEESLSWILET